MPDFIYLVPKFNPLIHYQSKHKTVISKIRVLF